MPIVKSIVAGIVRPIVLGIGGAVDAAVDTLVFHALDDVAGVFSADVIVGTGVLAEGRTSTIYLPDDSSVWQSFGSAVPGEYYAGSQWRLYTAPALTNSQIRSNDLANVEWTAANMTVAKDATGMQNDANGASTLTATAGNATVIANAITDASDDQCTRWFIKRKTGTGVIEITVDNGITWQDVTTEVASSAGFNECLEDQAALANPQIGIRIVTDTDAVYVGNAECHLSKLDGEVRASGPLFTAGSTITTNQTGPTFDKLNHGDATSAAWYVEVMHFYNSAEATGSQPLISSSGGENSIMFLQSGNLKFNALSGTDGSVAAPEVSGQAFQYGLAFNVASAEGRMNADGTWGTKTTNFDGIASYAGAFLYIGNTASDRDHVTLFRNLRRYSDSTYATAEATIDGLIP